MTSAILADVATIHAGGRLGLSGNDFIDGAAIPAYGAAGLNGYLDVAEYADQSAIILSSIGARCGKCFLVSGPWTSLANTQVILPDPATVDPTFLWYQLNDEARWHRSGSAQPFIKPSDVKAHRVFLPSLAEQRRIAAILDHADALRAKRRQVLTHLNAVVSSIFDDMFTRESHPKVALGEIASVKGGKRLPKGAPYAVGPTSHPYIRVTDLRDGTIRTDNLRFLTPDVQRRVARYTVDEGDVIISIAGSIGLTAAVPPDLAGANLTENAAKIVPRESGVYSGAWLARVLQTRALQDQIARKVGQVTIGKLALFRIEQLELPLPPLALQETFVDQAAKVDALRSGVQRTATAEDELFTSLQGRAFRAEL